MRADLAPMVDGIRKFLVALTLAALAERAVLGVDWYISTEAGNGVAGLNGDGLPARRTSLYLPQDGAVGPDGNFYFTDWNNHRIRRVADGVVVTVAGTGELGAAEDAPALDVSFNHPTNIAFDHDGLMVIAAWHNSKVKRLDLATGLVANLAGTGARSFGGDDGPGNDALLDLPSSVAIDSQGNILISDQANFRIRLLEPGGTIRTICGVGVQGYTGDGGPASLASLNSPVGQAAPPAGKIAVDSQDRIYIADTGNHVIRLIDTDGTIRTIAGTGQPGYSGDGGPASGARLNTPSDVAVAPDGTVYIADTMNNAIRAMAPDGTITTIAGTGDPGFAGDGGLALDAKLNRPYGIALAPDGSLYVIDTHNHRVRRLTLERPQGGGDNGEDTPVEIIPCPDEIGSICTYAGTGRAGYNGDGRDRLLTDLYWPMDIEFTPSERIYVLDWNNHMVREILPDGKFNTDIGTDFVGDGPLDESDLAPPGAPGLTVSLNHPTDVQEFPNGDLLLMSWHNHKLRVFNPDTRRVVVMLGSAPGFAGDGGPAQDARVNQPPHGVLDGAGNLFLIDQRNERIRVLRQCAERRGEAIIETVAGTGTAGFNGDGPALETQLNFPAGSNPEPSGGIALDANGVIYFADTLNHRVRRLQFTDGDFAGGVITTIAGTGTAGFSGDGGPGVEAQINYPQDLEIGPDGNLYFADTNNHRVRRIDLGTGVIETVAGTGEEGYGGDGGPATEARLSRPFGIGFDRLGDLYIADTFNGRIRRVKLSTGEGGLEPIFPATYADSYVEVRDCRFSVEHGGVYIRVLANEVGAAAYQQNLNPLPVGTVVVKEEYSAPGCGVADLLGWRAMRKEAPGFDAQDGDWHWQKVSAERDVIFDTKTTCIGCHRVPDCERRDLMCTEPGGLVDNSNLRLVLSQLPATLLSVTGTPTVDVHVGNGRGGHDLEAPYDIYAVGADPGDGLGPYVVRYDGQNWRRLVTGAQGNLWWISDKLIDGQLYLCGAGGLILSYDPQTGTFTRHETPGDALLFGIWGSDAQHLWAVGGDLANEDHGGVVWFYDGQSWTDVAEARALRPDGIPTLYKVWGRSENEVYAAGRLGVILRYEDGRWSQVPSDSTRPLFTIHGNDRHVVASGGFGDGVILELEGKSFVARTPQGAPQMNGVFMSARGSGAAVGAAGAYALRTVTGWELQPPANVPGFLDFHAVWMDPRGGVWAVGGDLSIDMRQGMLAYAGAAAIGGTFKADGPCPTGPDRGEGTVSYEGDILPLFDRHGCTNFSCHGGPLPASGFDLTTFETTFGPGLEAESVGLCNVVPQVPRMSYLLEKVGPQPRIGARMPFGGAPLSDAEISLIETWILEGAPRELAGPSVRFARADVNADGSHNVSDPVAVFTYLFAGGQALSCLDAADADDDGKLGITDGIYVLNFLFGSGAPPLTPFPECGEDPTDDELDCASFEGCG